MLMVVLMSTSAAAQGALPPSIVSSGNSIEAAFELLKQAPRDERACAGAGGVVLVNAVCFPGKACTMIDRQNIERVACLPAEANAGAPEVSPPVDRRARKAPSRKKS
jgi:hypothetical protein